jgi:hypothetical protein
MRALVRLGLLATMGCNGTPAPAAPAPPVEPEGAIAPSPQRTGVAARGWEALVGEGYVGCGIPREVYDQYGDALGAGRRLARQRGADLPYFLNEATTGGVSTVTPNCLGCHAAWLRGELVIGLGEVSSDLAPAPGLNRALAATALGLAEAPRRELLKVYSRLRVLEDAVPRTIGANPADHFAAILFAHRDPATLAWSEEPLLPIDDEPTIPVDVPAWWLLKKKAAMFHTGAGRGDQARIMMTASTMCVDDVATARAIDAYFPDIRAYVLSLEAPRYPEAIDAARAARGAGVFARTCAACHGTYGRGGHYVTRVIPLARVRTDPALADHAGQFAAPFRRWFGASFYGEVARLEPGAGYVAPPLDGVWATAPYLHNGAVPNLEALLDSRLRRPRTWIRRGRAAYDLGRVGWPNEAPPPEASEKEIYDTAIRGYGNGGHTFGDQLTPDARADVIEYLKTL